MSEVRVPDERAPAAPRDLSRSPTRRYLLNRLGELAGGRKISVLDLGCGDGGTIEMLLPYGYDLYGYDFVRRQEQLRVRLGPRLGAEFASRIRVTLDERSIPFGDEQFDVVYANQVFEHVKFLDPLIAECARVLKPGGVLLANFPLVTRPLEAHLRIPSAHWLPPGEFRVRYLQLFYATVFRGRLAGRSALEHARLQDRYLQEKTFYRLSNEIVAVGSHYFEDVALDTGAFIRAKAELMRSAPHAGTRFAGRLLERVQGRRLDALITHFVNAAFVMSGPRKSN